MSKITDAQIEDFRKYYVARPVAFSPEHNKAVIERTIEKYEAKRRAEAKAYKEKIMERSDAVITFLKAVDKGKVPNVEKFFGRKKLAELRGQKILQILEKNYKGQYITKLDEINN